MNERLSTVALIVAAGRGSRAGQGKPKQYRDMPDGSGGSVLARSIAAFADNEVISSLCVAIHKSDVKLYENIISNCNKKDKISYVLGGEDRQASVLNGLQALAEGQPQRVFIHDAARPFVSQDLIERCLDNFTDTDGVIPTLPVTDTLKKAENGQITETVPRDGLYRAQTPQLFDFAKILKAHKAAPQGSMTDDAAVAERAGLRVRIIDGETQNIKLTTEEDFAMTSP